MGRIRTVKPEVALHEGLFDIEKETGLPIRFAWVVLPTATDREGRFLWQPRRLKAQVLPYDDVDFSRVMDAWLARGLVVKYRVNGVWYGCIPTFTKHQVVNNREAASDKPGIDEADEVIDNRNNNIDALPTRDSRDEHATGTPLDPALVEGKGREGNRKEKGTRESTRPAAGLHDSLPMDAWEEWLSVRRKRRWPVDDITLTKQLRILAPFDTEAQREMLNTSIQAGWQGVFPLKGPGARQPPRQRAKTVAELEAEEAARAT